MINIILICRLNNTAEQNSNNEKMFDYLTL